MPALARPRLPPLRDRRDRAARRKQVHPVSLPRQLPQPLQGAGDSGTHAPRGSDAEG